MLKTGAILNFLVVVGHLACLPWLYPVLSIYRIDGIMETLALRYGAAIPYLLTVAIAFIFAVFGLYDFRAPGSSAHRDGPQQEEGGNGVNTVLSSGSRRMIPSPLRSSSPYSASTDFRAPGSSADCRCSKQVFTPLPPSSCCGPSRALRKWP